MHLRLPVKIFWVVCPSSVFETMRRLGVISLVSVLWIYLEDVLILDQRDWDFLGIFLLILVQLERIL